MPIRKPRTVARRPVQTAEGAPQKPDRSAAGQTVPDGFFRDLVWNLRNGVIAVTRDGRIAVMNEVAYRILGLPQQTTDIGLPFAQVLKDRPDV